MNDQLEYVQTRYVIQARRKGSTFWYATSTDSASMENIRTRYKCLTKNTEWYDYRIIKLVTHCEVVEE